MGRADAIVKHCYTEPKFLRLSRRRTILQKDVERRGRSTQETSACFQLQAREGAMKRVTVCLALLLAGHSAHAALVTDPNDPRSWQGATVGTFAQLFFGSNTATTRQQVVDQKLLDDGIFNSAGYLTGTLIHSVGQYSGQGGGTSLDSTGTGVYDYVCCGPNTRFDAANAIDDQWMQTSGVIGETVWDLGFQATKAAVFNTIDHGPLPLEAIESTVYLSNDYTDPTSWVQAVTQRVWLEGFQPNTGILWDGFTYAVGTPGGGTFRYASVIWGGPGAFQADGDNEINGIMGLKADFTPNVPEPGVVWLLVGGLGALAFLRRKRS
jgi:hypothetical protein